MGRTASKKKRRAASPATEAPVRKPPAATLSDTERWKWIGLAAFIFAAAVAVMWPTTKGDFYTDDTFYIESNSLLDEPDRIWKAFFVPGSFIEYYPIEQSLQWMLYLCFGKHPYGYHIVNVILHGFNALAVWYFLRKLGLRLAWLGALVYAVYPLSVETVGFISEFKNTLSFAPFIAAMCLYISYARDGKKTAYWPALTLYAIAMMCKISMMSFPLVLLLYDWYLRGRITVKDLKSCAPFAVVALALAGTSYISGEIYHAAIHDHPPGPTLIGGPLSHLALVGLSLSFYLTHTLMPFRPLTIYPIWPIDPPSLLQFLPWPLLILGGWWLWRKRDTWGRHAILGVGTFTLFLLPTLGFMKISYMCLSFVLDHLLYLPMIFLLALVLAGLDNLHRQLSFWGGRVLWAVTAAVVVALTIETYTFAGIFANQDELFAYDYKYNPGSWFIQGYYGLHLWQQNRYAEAVEHLQISNQMNPDFFMPDLALGKIALAKNDLPLAESHFRELVRIAPYAPMSYACLGDLLMQEKRTDEAYAVFKDELSKIPDCLQASDDLASIEVGMGHKDDAINHFRQSLDINPDDSYAKEQLEKLGPP